MEQAPGQIRRLTRDTSDGAGKVHEEERRDVDLYAEAPVWRSDDTTSTNWVGAVRCVYTVVLLFVIVVEPCSAQGTSLGRFAAIHEVGRTRYERGLAGR